MHNNEKEKSRQRRLEKKREYRRRYRESEHGKQVLSEYAKKYRNTEHGKQVMSEYAKKYRNTDHGKRILRKAIDKYQEERTCIQLANHSRIWLFSDSPVTHFLKLLKQEYRTRDLIERLQSPTKDMASLMKLAKTLIPLKTKG